VTTSSIEIDPQLGEFAGLHRVVDVGVRLAPIPAQAAVAAKSVAAIIEEFDDVVVRLVEARRHGSRTHITVAVCLGSIDDVKVAAAGSRRALALIARVVEDLAAYEPAFVPLPAGAPATVAPAAARVLREVG
jgi:hypothetical protein